MSDDNEKAAGANELSATASGEIDGTSAGVPAKIKWSIAGTGLWAGALVVGGAIFVELNWLSPASNPPRFMVTVFLAFVCGLLVGTAALKGRLTDALREKEAMRGEMNRMAEEKGALYDRVLQGRLSSSGPKRKK